MNDRERVKLLHAPYHPPALRRGDRATCLLRDGEVIITSWSDGRISWPRCRAVDARGGSGLLVDEELGRAVRSESAVAIKYWWGVSTKAVWHWRQALGVGRMDSEGSQRLIRAAAAKGAAVLREHGLTDEQCDRMSRTAKALNLIRFARRKPAVPPWTRRELRLLGKLPDEEVAAKIGRTARAVRIMRTRLGIPTARDRRRRQ